MKIGFQTIGNATLIGFDQNPIICTDPWIIGNAYFGSWGLSHIIPDEQINAIKNCKYIWFSHGHPDHLSQDSLPLFKGKKILLADHVGNRIQSGLIKKGYDVSILEDRKWVKLSDNIKVLSIADYNQDSIILIDINGRLLVNLNDASEMHGWGHFVKKISKKYSQSILLALSGYGDADMINYYTEDGKFIEPFAAQKLPVGEQILGRMNAMNCNTFVPFSSLHVYQRNDSLWANEYTTPVEAHEVGFNSTTKKILPAFIEYNCENDDFVTLSVKKTPTIVYPSEHFGDNWNDILEKEDIKKINFYFNQFEHLHKHIDFINFRVGKKDNIFSFNKNEKHNKGVMFEVPRQSLMTAIEFEIFDDLLIGNFMKTTLFGKWGCNFLYPDFTPYVAKYGDNGYAKKIKELNHYFSTYCKRAPFNYLMNLLEKNSDQLFRQIIPNNSKIYEMARSIYWKSKSLL